LHPGERLLHLAEQPMRLGNNIRLSVGLKLADKILVSFYPWALVEEMLSPDRDCVFG
jgi:hypothetical protein